MRCALFGWILLALLASCSSTPETTPAEKAVEISESKSEAPYLIVLGTAQDGGSPHIGCEKACCATLLAENDHSRSVVSLGLVNPRTNQCWMFEATPDFTAQVAELVTELPAKRLPDGVFVTHAHIGHYTGLMYLGREALGAHQMPVYTMPRMKQFLESNGPWSQLVSLKNVELKMLQDKAEIALTEKIVVKPFTVPHRDEFSETVGFEIRGPGKTALFIPDIDKWQKWDTNVLELIQKVDYAFLDATFYDQSEVPERDMSEIPHPFVVESMKLMDTLPETDRRKVHFIHLNHSNPLLDEGSPQTKEVQKKGYQIARKGMRVSLE